MAGPAPHRTPPPVEALPGRQPPLLMARAQAACPELVAYSEPVELKGLGLPRFDEA